MLVLSGRHYSYHEQERLSQVKRHVARAITPFQPDTDAHAWQSWIDRQLDGFSAYYLTCTPPERIAEDLDLLQRLADDEIHVSGAYAADTDTVDYRVITRDPLATRGCFHRIAGVLTASRMDILAADINTTRDGVVVDNFRVVDQDFDDHVPDHRIEEITDKLRRALTRNLNVRSLFKKSRRISAPTTAGGLSNLRSRVVIDNDSSDTRTIIDVFAHDRRGLLYVVARALNELNLSVDLAKISTHYDQVVDVFYVQEADGTKVDDARLAEIHDTLTGCVTEFENDGYRQFAGE
jgi:[protein-PII] uridylyltransferase